MEKNFKKQAVYAELTGKLKKALKYEFYLQAIVYEYAIIEDRLNSFLKYSDITQDIKTVGKKIGKLQKVENKLLKKYFTAELELITTSWVSKRNQIIHSFVKNPLSEAELKLIAEEGKEVIELLSSKSSYYKRATLKTNQL